MSAPRGLSWWLVVLAAAIFLLGTVQGSEDIVERQNPSFITQLPTTASSPIVVVTTTSISTVSSPPDVQTSPQTTLETTTPAPTPSPSTTSSVPSSPSASANTYVDDAFFGRVPTANPDAVIISIFLVVFLFFAVVHGLHYRANTGNPKQAPTATLSRQIVLFCLARIVVCLLRLVWIAVSKSALLIFATLVAENAGIILLIVVNYHLTKQMISFCNLKYSLWARSVIKRVANVTISIVFAAIFLLHTFGVALFEIQVSSGRDPTTEAQLVQASEALLIAIGLVFNFVVLTTMVTSRWAPVGRLGVRIVIYVLGPGLLTLVSQLMRLIAMFMIWKPVTPLSAEFLSKSAFYITGFGAEVLILVLYGFWDKSLLALTRESLHPRRHANGRSAAQVLEDDDDPSGPWATAATAAATAAASTTAKSPHTTNVDSKTSKDDDDPARGFGNRGEASEEKFGSTTVISSSRLDTNTQHDEEKGRPAASDRPWARAMRRISKLSTLRESTIGKAT